MRAWTEDQQQLAYRFAHLLLPLDAVACEPWESVGDDDDDWRRFFITREWDVTGICVSVGGEQNHRGDVTRWMHVGGEDQCSTSQRSALISALLAAGSLLDALNAGRELAPMQEVDPLAE